MKIKGIHQEHLQAWRQVSRVFTNAYGEEVYFLDCALFGKSINCYDAYRFAPEKTYFCDYNFRETFLTVILTALTYKKALNEKRNVLNSWLAVSVIKSNGHKVLCPEYTDMTWQQMTINCQLHKDHCKKADEDYGKKADDYHTKKINSLVPMVKNSLINLDAQLTFECIKGLNKANQYLEKHLKIPLENLYTSVKHLSTERRYVNFG